MIISTSRSRPVRAGALAAVFAFALASCGGDDDDSAAPTTVAEATDPAQPTEPPSAAPTAAPASDAPQPTVDDTEPMGTDAPVEGDTTGVSDDTIRVSVSGPWSGPIAQIANKTYTDGYELWAAEVNAAGGINGRKIEFIKVDNQNTPDGSVAACVEIQDNDSFAALVAVTAGSDECFEEAGIPVIDLVPRAFDPSWTNVIGVTYIPGLAATEASFMVSDYANAQDRTVGMFVNGDSVGLVEQSAAIKEELAALGVEIVQEETIAQGQASFVPEVARMKDAGVDFVILNVGTESAGIIRDAGAAGFAPQFYIGPASAIDLIALATQGALNGVIGTRGVTTMETPEFAEYAAKLAEVFGEEAGAAADSTGAQSYAHAQIFGHILELAGPNPTRESFLEAAATVDGFETGLLGPFTLAGRDALIGISSLRPIECCSEAGVFMSLGPVAEEF